MARVASPERPPRPIRQAATARSTLVVDRCMAYGITIGGIGVVAAVLGIFVFILAQILPLFRGAQVQPLSSRALPAQAYAVLGADEWAELPFVLTPEGTMLLVDLVGNRGVQRAELGLDPTLVVSAARYHQAQQTVLLGTADGRFSLVKLQYKATFDQGERRVTAQPSAGPVLPLGQPGQAIRQIAYGEAGGRMLVAALQEAEGRSSVHAVTLGQPRGLLGAGTLRLERAYELSDQIQGQPQAVVVPSQADGVIVATREGTVYAFALHGQEMVLRQVWTPFQDLPQTGIATMDFVFGSASLAFVSTSGVNRVFSLYVAAGQHERRFGQTKSFPALPDAATFYAASLRNKAFLTGSGQVASLRYSTTETIRWQATLPFTVQHALVGSKYHRLLFLDTASTLHVYHLDDPHPESGLTALLGKIWYEGASQPAYSWQSSGGSDDFEPKLSLIPLMLGSLKGTIYAMLFAVPIALLAAIYASQFLDPSWRVLMKPTVEVMASLPSVILGFIAALWLAPLIETRVPSLLLMLGSIPAVALLCGRVWSSLPPRTRSWIKPGYEFLAFMPVLLVTSYVAWSLGPFLERLCFVVTYPDTGQTVADFRLWWLQVTGASFEQRNSLVVGFIMGFAIIPIIFTITEDALSSVPAELKSASLALGASRWQTAIRVVLPTAAAGIFSALMIGLGRAVGETMIMLMATGNTPILDLNIFAGMRTLSANIAVELPEAPLHSTLYRTLFLGGMVLFLLTFVMNTLAEVVRQRLRERYRTL